VFSIYRAINHRHLIKKLILGILFLMLLTFPVFYCCVANSCALVNTVFIDSPFTGESIQKHANYQKASL